MLNEILDNFHIESSVNIKQYSPLDLAYIGDCVYELFVRTYLLKNGKQPVNKLHKSAVALVNASKQAEYAHAILDKLTEEETDIYKRGRNTNSKPPKNADLTDYKAATGFEALLGYLYLMRRSDRIAELLNCVLI